MKISNIGRNMRAIIEVSINGFFVERLINLLKQNETKEIQISIVDNFIMWRFLETNTWYKLISLSFLKNGSSEIEFSTTPLHIVYKINSEWNELIEIETLNKPKNKHIGMIAYELAVDLNYQNSVKEWFETLNERIDFEWIEVETYIKWKTIESASWNILFDITTIYPEPNIYVVTFFDINGNVTFSYYRERIFKRSEKFIKDFNSFDHYINKFRNDLFIHRRGKFK